MQKCETPPGYDPPEIPPVKSASKVETLFQCHTAELEYCCSVLDPHQRKYMYKLDSVQRCACRVTTKDWCTDYETLSDRLNWLPLRTRGTHQKLILSYKIMNNMSSIPSSHFIPHPPPDYLTIGPSLSHLRVKCRF